VPRFTVEQVLGPPVLSAYLDRISARPDAASAEVRGLLDRVRSGGAGRIDVPDKLARSAAVPAFLNGLSLLSQKQLDPAAASFRIAMNLAPDFYPAMVYLGACYAAGGKDKEAAAAWRTALIKEGDTVAVHVLLADAWLRQNRPDQALQAIERARGHWPDDDTLNQRFALASLLAGRYADGLDAVDKLVVKGAGDEPSLALALLVLYEGFEKHQPIQDVDRDRARMVRLSDSYRTLGGPSLALVNAWVAAATQKH
jgi:tetratricopeptide (TPR) repeat protein